MLIQMRPKVRRQVVRMAGPDEKNTDPRIPNLVGRYLSSVNDPGLAAAVHLDDDLLTAFIDGSLMEREARAAVRHLVNCAFCRRSTAALLRLDAEFQVTPAPLPDPENAPTQVADVLHGFLSRLPGFGGEAVFGHQEPEPLPDKPEDKSESEN